MDLQARKLHLIEDLIGIQDEDLLKKVEALLKSARSNTYEMSLKPMTTEELQARALKSEDDIINNRLTDLDDLIKEAENW